MDRRIVRDFATTRRTLVAFVVAMAFSAWFFSVGPYAQMREHGGIVDERFGSGSDDIERAIDAYGEAGRDAYRTFLVADLAFPLLHAAWLTLFITMGTRRWKSLPPWTIGLPVGALASDWIENVAFLGLVAQHPGMAHGVAVLAVIAMHAKLAFHVAALLVVITVIAWLVAHPVRRGRRPSRRPVAHKRR